LLDVIEDHRAAVKYDLIAHGVRLEWLPSSRLTWGDAVTILTMQPPERSSLNRELNPADYDQTKVTERLEQIIVMLARSQALSGNQTEVAAADLPVKYSDVFAVPGVKPDVEMLSFEEIDRRMGWA
jgi:hypothetical protein